MSQYLQSGVKVSLLLHGVIVVTIVYLGTFLSESRPLLRIDFSFETTTVETQPSNPSAKSEQQVHEEKTVAVNNPRVVEEKIRAVKPEKTEGQPLLPEKPQAEPKKIAALRTKKLFVVKKQSVVLPTDPISKSLRAVAPNDKSRVARTIVTEATVATFETPKTTTPQNLTPSSPASTPDDKSSSVKEMYLRANYSYIRDTIERKTSYPKMARKMGWEGKVLLSFIVAIDGRVEDIQIIKSCGYKALDRNAIKTILHCAPFPKPPVKTEVILPITYHLK